MPLFLHTGETNGTITNMIVFLCINLFANRNHLTGRNYNTIEICPDQNFFIRIDGNDFQKFFLGSDESTFFLDEFFNDVHGVSFRLAKYDVSVFLFDTFIIDFKTFVEKFLESFSGFKGVEVTVFIFNKFIFDDKTFFDTGNVFHFFQSFVRGSINLTYAIYRTIKQMSSLFFILLKKNKKGGKMKITVDKPF